MPHKAKGMHIVNVQLPWSILAEGGPSPGAALPSSVASDSHPDTLETSRLELWAAWRELRTVSRSDGEIC